MSNKNQENGLWKGIWSLKVSNKVKNMVWRACRNSLPMKMNLVWRMIIDSPICDRCQDSPDSVLHALWSCREVDVVRSDAELWSFRSGMHFDDFKIL